MIHVKDSLLPTDKVWSLDFLGIRIYIYIIYNIYIHNVTQTLANLITLSKDARKTEPPRNFVRSFEQILHAFAFSGCYQFWDMTWTRIATASGFVICWFVGPGLAGTCWPCGACSPQLDSFSQVWRWLLWAPQHSQQNDNVVVVVDDVECELMYDINIYIYYLDECKRILRIRTLTQFILNSFWCACGISFHFFSRSINWAATIRWALEFASPIQTEANLTKRCKWVTDGGGFVFPRWISTALFSAANVFYGLTPNGFKACIHLPPRVLESRVVAKFRSTQHHAFSSGKLFGDYGAVHWSLPLIAILSTIERQCPRMISDVSCQSWWNTLMPGCEWLWQYFRNACFLGIQLRWNMKVAQTIQLCMGISDFVLLRQAPNSLRFCFSASKVEDSVYTLRMYAYVAILLPITSLVTEQKTHPFAHSMHFAHSVSLKKVSGWDYVLLSLTFMNLMASMNYATSSGGPKE